MKKKKDPSNICTHNTLMKHSTSCQQQPHGEKGEQGPPGEPGTKVSMYLQY